MGYIALVPDYFLSFYFRIILTYATGIYFPFIKDLCRKVACVQVLLPSVSVMKPQQLVIKYMIL